MSSSLTKRQRQILILMRQHGPAKFAGGTRGFYWRVLPYGVAIQAYMDPELFLKNRGLLTITPVNAPGTWYRLTEEGERRATRLKDEEIDKAVQHAPVRLE